MKPRYEHVSIETSIKLKHPDDTIEENFAFSWFSCFSCFQINFCSYCFDCWNHRLFKWSSTNSGPQRGWDTSGSE